MRGANSLRPIKTSSFSPISIWARLRLARCGADGFSVIPFAAGVPGIVDIEYHDQALYYLEIFGKIGVIRYTGVSNQVPVASLQR